MFLFISCESTQVEKKNEKKTELEITKVDTIPRISFYPHYVNLLYFNDNLKDEFRWINEVHFAQKYDTIFMGYFVSNGEFINGSADSLDYAGYFLINELIDNQVTFKVKIYRYYNDSMKDEDLIFANLNLEFTDNYDTIYWNVIGLGSYLVQNDTLVPIRN